MSISLTNQVDDIALILTPADYVGPRATMADENGTIVATGVTEMYIMPGVNESIVRITLPPWLATENDDGSLTLSTLDDD